MHPFSAPTPLRHAFWLLCLLALFAGLLTPAYAQSGKRVALVIGNEAYQHESTLRNPVNDTRLIQATLRAAPLRFDEVIPVVNANRAQTLQALARFKSLAQGADVAFVYYSGHGMINSKRQNHLLPVDMPKVSANAGLDTDTALKAYGINEDDLLEAVEGARVQVLVLDACRDNGFLPPGKTTTKGLARRADQSRNRLIAYATEEGRVAEDGKGQNSTYAKSLARHLVRTDWPLLKVFDEVATDVERETSNAQSPTRSGNLRTSVYLLASVVPESVRTAPVAQPIPQPAPPVQAPAPQPAPPTAQALRPGSVIKDCSDCSELVVIPAGRFMMGSNEEKDEKPIHPVNIKQFAIGKTEVTQAQWQAVMGSNPSRFANCGPTCPVEQVSWDDVQQFIQKLNAKTGREYRLPSEAEWEYAARAGSQSKYSFGDSESQLGQHAWYGSNSGNTTKPVAGKQTNAFGLHDMHGNVSEWVEDCWHENYSGAPTDGSAWTTSCKYNHRLARGGTWNWTPESLRSASRYGYSQHFQGAVTGFRLARTLLAP